MKKTFFLAILISNSFYVQAQEQKKEKPTYKTAVGIRLNPFGISFKANMPNTVRSFEINCYINNGFVGSFLQEWNVNLNKPKNLRAYIGGGGNIGFLDDKAGGGAIVGVGGVIGVDYKFLRLPFNLSLDYQPTYQFKKESEFKGYVGIAARFTF